MKLSKEDADLFFKLMWGLQFYVNDQRQILPQVNSVEEYAGLPSADGMQVRDALWENPGLIDAYVKENPDGLPAEELDIVRKWKRFVSGTFQIFRLLKKHAIFIGENSQVYGVMALHESLEEVFYDRPLPIMVEAVLLPFKGQIIYDGLLTGYSIYFGAGIRSGLKEDYMDVKQNGRIITTLVRRARELRWVPPQRVRGPVQGPVGHKRPAWSRGPAGAGLRLNGTVTSDTPPSLNMRYGSRNRNGWQYPYLTMDTSLEGVGRTGDLPMQQDGRVTSWPTK